MEKDRNKITVQVEGTAEDGGDLSLSNFIDQLQNIRALLAEADRIVTGEQQSTVFRVTNLSHSSPSAIELTGYPKVSDKDFTNQVVEYVTGSLDSLVTLKQFPKDASQKFIRSVKKLFDGVGKRIDSIKVFGPSADLPIIITSDVVEQLEVSVLRQVRSFGSVKGVMQAYNSHTKTRYFNLYPPIPGVEIKCIFSKELVRKASDAVERNVTVSGTLIYTVGNVFPDEVIVNDIEVHKNDNELPTLESFSGSATDATGSLSTEDFIRQTRNEWH